MDIEAFVISNKPGGIHHHTLCPMKLINYTINKT